LGVCLWGFWLGGEGGGAPQEREFVCCFWKKGGFGFFFWGCPKIGCCENRKSFNLQNPQLGGGGTPDPQKTPCPQGGKTPQRVGIFFLLEMNPPLGPKGGRTEKQKKKKKCGFGGGGGGAQKTKKAEVTCFEKC